MVTNIKRKPSDIFAWPVIGALFKNRYILFLVRAVTILLFLSALYFGFRYPNINNNPYTTVIFWSLFWPFFMILSLILIGPAFCGICPHGTIGRWLTQYGKQKEIPTWLKKRGIGLTILVVSYWIPLYLFPGLLSTPWVASLLFLVLTFIALFFYYNYKNMSYCSYICPIGAVTKSFGKIGMTKLGTYQEACRNCKTFDCAKACKFHLQPFLFDKKHTMKDCTLCMDCTQVCEAVSFSITKPGYRLEGEIKENTTTHTWVYILLLGVITITMSFHHSLGHSAIKTLLPWYQLGEWNKTVLPIGIDWVGFYALLMALFATLFLIIGGFKIASVLLRIPFKEFLHKNSYALAPLMIIGSLSHILSFFFLHYGHSLANAFYWLIGSTKRASALASMHDSWIHLFNLFGFLAALWSAWLLYKRINEYQVQKISTKLLGWFAASSIIWFYIALLILKLAIRH